MIKNVWKILSNSLVGLIIGISLTLFIFYLQRHEIEIGYTVLNTNIIAQSAINKNITILFKKDTMPNLNIVEFGLWNAGTEYIDKKNISETYPLAITPNNPVQVLDYKITKRSRKNLNFNLSKSIANSSNIVLQIEGDDGLEKSDGIRIQVIYSGDQNVVWGVAGRIKGNLNSFRKYAPNDLIKYEKKSTSTLIVFGILFIFMFCLIIFIIIKMMTHEYNPNIGTTIFVFVIPLILIIVSLNIFWDYIFYSGTLDWLIK